MSIFLLCIRDTVSFECDMLSHCIISDIMTLGCSRFTIRTNCQFTTGRPRNRTDCHLHFETCHLQYCSSAYRQDTAIVSRAHCQDGVILSTMSCRYRTDHQLSMMLWVNLSWRNVLAHIAMGSPSWRLSLCILYVTLPSWWTISYQSCSKTNCHDGLSF